LQAGDDELSAVIPQDFASPLQSALQRHLVQLAFDQSKMDLPTTGVLLPVLTIQETKVATKGNETNLCSRTFKADGLSEHALRELRNKIDEVLLARSGPPAP
jgi:hypothetical protein